MRLLYLLFILLLVPSGVAITVDSTSMSVSIPSPDANTAAAFNSGSGSSCGDFVFAQNNASTDCMQIRKCRVPDNFFIVPDCLSDWREFYNITRPDKVLADLPGPDVESYYDASGDMQIISSSEGLNSTMPSPVETSPTVTKASTDGTDVLVQEETPNTHKSFLDTINWALLAAVALIILLLLLLILKRKKDETEPAVSIDNSQ